MTTDQVIEYFGSQIKAAKAIGMTRGAFTNWVMRGYIPSGPQLKFQKISKGKLKADIESATKKENKDD